MSKPVVIIVVAVAALVAAGGAYHFMGKAPDPAPIAPEPPGGAEVYPNPVHITPKRDHGSFQERFQPSMPPSK